MNVEKNCSNCKFHNSNATYPEKECTHCYHWNVWNESGVCHMYEPMRGLDEEG